MTAQLSRRHLIRLAAIGGVVFASRLTLRSSAAAMEEFYFVQLSDLHWGFADPKANPDPKGTLEKSIAAINAAPQQPDFIVFTGDLTHKTDDPAERRKRMIEVKAMLDGLTVKQHIYLPGEHDAGADAGKAFQEIFGPLHQSFDHKGLHFVALDNASDPKGFVGAAQLAWLAEDLKRQPQDQPLVVLAHRPLFDLKPDWDWATADGAKVTAQLQPFKKTTVFYGHIHQQNTHHDGNITHVGALSAMYPLPAPGAAPKKAPLPWDASAADHGVGWREIEREDVALKIDDHATV